MPLLPGRSRSCNGAGAGRGEGEQRAEAACRVQRLLKRKTKLVDELWTCCGAGNRQAMVGAQSPDHNRVRT
jgi:hypothetical protein